MRRARGYPNAAPISPIVLEASQCKLVSRGGGSSAAADAAAAAAAAAAGISCLPPFIGGLCSRPMFSMIRTHLSNIGHTLWDDAMPFIAAMGDLGLSEQLGQYDTLLMQVPGPWAQSWRDVFGAAAQPPWKGDQGVRELFQYLSPNMDPAEHEMLKEEAGDRLVLFEAIAGGLTGMSPHNERVSMRVHGAEPDRRSVWRTRVFLMQQMGFSEAHITMPASKVPGPAAGKRLRLALVKGKREVANRDALLAELTAAYPDISVESVAWEGMGGLKNEAEYLRSTHIMISNDGTASLNVPFLPEGAVFINLGVARPVAS